MTAVIIQCLLFIMIFTGPLWAEEKKGGIILAFDDGYPCWTTVIAPEVRKVGGKATGFVNNHRIRNGILSYEDLRDLRNKYGWEIGTHTYHHFNAPDYVKQKGVSVWAREELGASLDKLASEGLKPESLAFPFNASNMVVEKEAMKKVTSFRRRNAFPVLDVKIRDGSYPSASYELASHVPMELMRQWIDFAKQQDRYLFLYGHKVLPDEEFLKGTVASVTERGIVMEKTTGTIEKVKDDGELCLVPNTRRRLDGLPVKVTAIDKETVTASRDDMALLTKPGASFIIGDCYAVPVSYFRELVTYAADRVAFFTVSEALRKALGTSPAERKKSP